PLLLMTDWYAIRAKDEEALGRYNRLSFDERSVFFVQRAIGILSLGRIVVTDRLHAHILCMLMGVPHILLNNDYGKNWNFFETWMRGTPLCRLARNPDEAWAMALELAQQGKDASRPAEAPQPGHSDIERWSDKRSFDPKWGERARRAARHVPGGSTVLDMGCGM